MNQEDFYLATSIDSTAFFPRVILLPLIIESEILKRAPEERLHRDENNRVEKHVCRIYL